jgi:hypothetical protein
MRLFILAAVLAALSGCASNPQQQIAVDVATRIAVRHALDSPRAIEKARNIRRVAEQVKAVADQDATVATLVAVAQKEIDKLNLSPLERADAQDLLLLMSALLEQKLGSGDIKPDFVVTVGEFADLVLSALPVL